jgi:hypothetical protein
MREEMMKLINDNYELIKTNLYKEESKFLINEFSDDIEILNNYLYCLNEDIKDVTTVDELIHLIKCRVILECGVDEDEDLMMLNEEVKRLIRCDKE